MATATTKTTPTIEIPELAQKIREQFLSTVQQGQQISVDAAQAWVKAVSVIPVPDLPKVPGIPTVPVWRPPPSTPSMSRTCSTRSATSHCSWPTCSSP